MNTTNKERQGSTDGFADTAVADSDDALESTLGIATPGARPAQARGAHLETPGYGRSGRSYERSRSDGHDERYRIIGEHARGGLGRIMKARDVQMGRTVAIKELLESSTFAESLFIREALITARLQHPGIVPVHESGRWPSGALYYVMKLVSGKSLQALIQERERLRERMALVPNVLDVVETIAYAHSQGVIHRDIKPANIIIGDFGETIVVDWGLARDLEQPQLSIHDLAGATIEPGQAADQEGSVWHVTGNYSVSGRIVGTPAYMSPEQAWGQEVDERTDVYALGALLYEVLSGSRPYPGKELQVVLAYVRAGPPSPLAQRLAEGGEDIEPDLVAIVDKAMARDRDARYPSAKELADDLRRFQTGRLVSAHQYSLWTLTRRWLWRHRTPMLVALFALLVLAVTAVVSVNRIVEESDVAKRERAQARAAQRLAEKSRNELLFLQAEDSLDDDPTTAVAWLKKAPLTGAHFAEARSLFEEAVARGVARHVLDLGALVWSMEYLPDGRIAALANDGSVRLLDVARGSDRILFRDEDAGDRMALSPDGAWLALGTISGAIRVITLPESGGRSRTLSLSGHRGKILALRFTADSEQLVTLGSDRLLRVWDLASASEAARMALAGGKVALSAGADRVAVARPDRTVEVMQMQTREPMARVALPGRARAMQFSPDGRRLAMICADGWLRLLDVPSGEVTSLGRVPTNRMTRPLVFSPTGQWLASHGESWSIQLWHVSSRQRRGLYGHDNNIYELVFSADEARLASASDDGTARLWSLDSDDVRVLRGHTDDVLKIALSPDGDTVATSSMDGSVRIWPQRAGSEVVLSGHAQGLGAVAFTGRDELSATTLHGEVMRWELSSRTRRVVGAAQPEVMLWKENLSPDGRYVVAPHGNDKVIELWDVIEGHHHVLPWPGAGIRKVRFAPDSTAFVVVEASGSKAVVWSLASRQPRVLEHDERICGAAVAPGGEQVALVGTSSAKIRDLATGETLFSIPLPDGGSACETFLTTVRARYSPDGTWLALAHTRRGMTLWNLRTRTLRRFDVSRHLTHDFVFSPNNTYLATSHGDRSVHLLDMASGTSRRLGRHADAVMNMKFSPDETTLATASYDHTIRLWDVASGAYRVLRGHSASVTSVSFSGDGALLASASEDRTIRLWDIHDHPIPDEAALRAVMDASTTSTIGSDLQATTRENVGDAGPGDNLP